MAQERQTVRGRKLSPGALTLALFEQVMDCPQDFFIVGAGGHERVCQVSVWESFKVDHQDLDGGIFSLELAGKLDRCSSGTPKPSTAAS